MQYLNESIAKQYQSAIYPQIRYNGLFNVALILTMNDRGFDGIIPGKYGLKESLSN